MSAVAFFQDEAKTQVSNAIKEIEKESAAEVVVTVRASSWRYRHAHLLIGALVSMAALAALIFLPYEFSLETWLLDVAMAFVVGTAISSQVTTLERWLTPRSWLEQQVERGAKAAFVDLGITRTRDRSGVLVYVSILERRAFVVADLGVLDACGESLEEHFKAIDGAVRRADFEGFMAALAALGPPLAEAMPVREDDVNELPDEVIAV